MACQAALALCVSHGTDEGVLCWHTKDIPKEVIIFTFNVRY